MHHPNHPIMQSHTHRPNGQRVVNLFCNAGSDEADWPTIADKLSWPVNAILRQFPVVLPERSCDLRGHARYRVESSFLPCTRNSLFRRTRHLTLGTGEQFVPLLFGFDLLKYQGGKRVLPFRWEGIDSAQGFFQQGGHKLEISIQLIYPQFLTFHQRGGNLSRELPR
jgi:hypothetical protein